MNNMRRFLDTGTSALHVDEATYQYNIALAVIETFHPTMYASITTGVVYPVGCDINNTLWSTHTPPDTVRETSLVLVTEPVTRFKKKCTFHDITDIDDLLSDIEGGKNYHFRRLVDTLKNNDVLYKLDTDLELFATDAGLPFPFGDNNKQHLVEPELTSEQLARVEAIYADDITLYDTIEGGMSYVGEDDQFYIPFANLVANKKASIARIRYETEVGGFSLPDGTMIKTDLPTRLILTMAKMNALGDPTYVIPNWKMPNGVFTPLDATTIITIAEAGEIFIQSCFDKEAGLVSQINNATTVEELDAIIWE